LWRVPSLLIVRIRDPRPPDEPDDSGDDFDDESPPPPRRPSGPGPAELHYSVPTGVIAAKLAFAALLLALTVILATHEEVVIGVVATLAAAAYAARDLIARERLRADRDGLVVVRGYAGHRRLAWSELERISVESRLRLGARTETLELDTGEEIYLFGRYDLGTEPEQAFDELDELRPD
jgi:hypothetical protein